MNNKIQGGMMSGLCKLLIGVVAVLTIIRIAICGFVLVQECGLVQVLGIVIALPLVISAILARINEKRFSEGN